ncbi:MAG: FtsQ-type POTRA domain-containing protein [Candidatus Delongbacteria bacterium]|nr:FtsQ-type POTRA domain-containing protein [Candidatus Delongbacteria bacterium]
MKVKNILRNVVTFMKGLLILGLVVSISYGSYKLYDLYERTNKFNLTKIIVNDEFMLTKGEVIAQSKVKRDVRVMNIDIARIRENLKRSPFIKDADVRVVYPAAMVINVIENKPIAYINDKNVLKFVGDNGKVLGKVTPDKSYDLPIITDNDINENIIDYLNRTLKVSQFVFHQISEIKYTSKGIEISLVKASANVIIGRNDFDKKIILLENFIREEYDNISFSNVDYIDFRFDKQVILKELQTAENKM